MTHSIHFYLRLYAIVHMVKDHCNNEKNPRCLYYHVLCFTSCGTLTKNSLIGPLRAIDLLIRRILSGRWTSELRLAPVQ